MSKFDKFRRSRTDKWIAGVCGGMRLFDESGPVIIRIAFVVLSFFTVRIAVLLYLIAWLIIPKEDQ